MRTPLLKQLRRMLLLAREARRRGIPVKEYAESREAAWRMNRRKFLGRAAGVVPAAAGLATIAGCGSKKKGGGGSSTDVVVVGGGIAGLACGYRLMQAGVDVGVYEAQDRIGGRMYSGRNLFADNQVCELGGELIDTDHESIRNFAAELSIQIDDLAAESAGLGLSTETYYFGGVSVAPATILAQWAAVAPDIDTRLATLTDPEGYITYSDPNGAAALDAMSLEDWITAAAVPVELASLLRVAYEAEYGLPPDVTNFINLAFLIDTNTAYFHVYGDSDEISHTHLGNDTIPTALGAALGDRVQTGQRLVRVKETSSGRYELTFVGAAGTTVVKAQHVVLAIPFTVLRDVEMVLQTPLTAAKQLAIDKLPYGNNAKLMVGFTSRPWRTALADGQCIATITGADFETWDASRGQTGASGILVDYLSGDRATNVQYGDPLDHADDTAARLETLWPGMVAAKSGKAERFHWPSNPFVRGSYAAYQVGDYTTICGAEGERAGNLHFAGEHTSLDYQGYMNGGSESGELAAVEVMDDLGVSAAAVSAIMTAGGFARRSFLEMALSGRRWRRNRAAKKLR